MMKYLQMFSLWMPLLTDLQSPFTYLFWGLFVVGIISVVSILIHKGLK